MWCHTDSASSSQISRSAANGAHKRPGRNGKCQNPYCRQALITLNMFPSRGRAGSAWDGRGRGAEAGTGGSDERAARVQGLWGHLLAMRATVAPPRRAW